MKNFENIQIRKPNFKKLLNEVPHKPGVYIMRDRLGKVIYVGKAKDLRKRLANYFNPSRKTTSDAKTRSLIESIWNFDIHVLKNETESLLLESKLIKDYKPRYNILLRDDKRFIMAKINFTVTFPKIELVRIRKNDKANYYGPFTNSVALKSVIEWLIKYLGLRSCAPVLPTESDYKHCHDDIIKNCSAPCINMISKEKYLELAKKAGEILEGNRQESKEIIKMIEVQMLEASEKQNFELAGKLRDTLNSFIFLNKPNRKFTKFNINNSLDIKETMSEVEQLKESLNLPIIPRTIECFDISNISDTHIVASMVRFVNGKPDLKNYRRYRIKSVNQQDDFASMSEVIFRRYFRLLSLIKDKFEIVFNDSQESLNHFLNRISKKIADAKLLNIPDLIVVDGGKGQLSSALKELQKLGLHNQTIIGLAKKREEIFKPNQSNPINLIVNSPELNLLKRIRDEAHRFANGYHQILMKKRISESILDDCPGISAQKKELLLREFGSVARLKKASIKDISSIKGFSENSASNLLSFLNRN